MVGNITGGNLNAAGLSLSGNVVSPLRATSTIVAGSTISAVGNITGSNVNAVGLSLSGNVLSAINMTANITTTGNITAGNVSATGNINIAGQLVATVADATALAIALG
jgi:hypothetical protein